MHWKLKGTLQKVLGWMPGGDELHFQLQRRFGGLRDFNREFDIKVSDWEIMVARLAESGIPISGQRLFEIGSGWYPTFPLACYLAGAKRVVSVDLNRHMRPKLLLACAQRLGQCVTQIAKAVDGDVEEIRARHARMLEKLTTSGNLAAATYGVVEYHAPADASATPCNRRRRSPSSATPSATFANGVMK